MKVLEYLTETTQGKTPGHAVIGRGVAETGISPIRSVPISITQCGGNVRYIGLIPVSATAKQLNPNSGAIRAVEPLRWSVIVITVMRLPE